ncbi:MAG: helix-turn-helix domain-containing protein [Halioglobus sp.]
MFSQKKQESHYLDDLTFVHFGRDVRLEQLKASEEKSHVALYQSPQVIYQRWRYACAYEQQLFSGEGFRSFGLPERVGSMPWAFEQFIADDVLMVFSHEEPMEASAPSGCSGHSISIADGFLEELLGQIYHVAIESLIPSAGLYLPSARKLRVIREELRKWRELLACGASTRSAIIARREESLGLALIDTIFDAQMLVPEPMIKSEHSMKMALELIHDSELENISALDLCKHSGCSQRTLEKTFLKRFGITPKKYVKSLRLARVRHSLRNFDTQDSDTIIELAGTQGFWHMGQFAADYRSIYGELPSETLTRR